MEADKRRPRYDESTVLFKTFYDLLKLGFLVEDEGFLDKSQLSPLDNPSIRRYVRRITNLLYHKLSVSSLEYDAVVSIPTGGDTYADYLVDLIKRHGGRTVPRLCLDPVNHQEILYDSEVPHGSRLLVVDDSICTGKTAQTVTRALCAHGYKVTGYACAAQLATYDTPCKVQGPVTSVFNSRTVQQTIAWCGNQGFSTRW